MHLSRRFAGDRHAALAKKLLAPAQEINQKLTVRAFAGPEADWLRLGKQGGLGVPRTEDITQVPAAYQPVSPSERPSQRGQFPAGIEAVG